MTERVLEVNNLTGGYGKVQILNGIDLHVNKNEITTIIGPNGSGKSTFLKVVFGLATYYAGDIKYNNEDISGIRTDLLVKQGISYVPQLDNVFPTLTIQENLEMGAYQFKELPEDNLEHVYTIFDELKQRKHDLANTLSGGMRQMLALGRALMANPNLILLDEPTAALSPIYVTQILDKVTELRDNGVTILLVEQNAKAALKKSDRGYVFANGEVVHTDTADSMLNDPKISEYFLGIVKD